MPAWMLAACAPGDPAADGAAFTADVTEGDYPLAVAFDAAASSVGGEPSFAWDFGDGATGSGVAAAHTYVGEGTFTVRLTITGDGEPADAEATIEVGRPPCPEVKEPEVWGTVTDTLLTEISGVAQSWRDPDVLWVVEDARNPEELVAIEVSGAVLANVAIDGEFSDPEDLASGVDPVDGTPRLYVADVGNNDFDKTEFALWVFDEPEAPASAGPLAGLRMAVTYPTVAYDAETLLVDPWTEDLYVVTKSADGQALVFRKPAPHDGPGPTVLEPVATLDFATDPLSGRTTTGGAVSPAGDRLVIRTYERTAWLWRIDRYLPFEAAFDDRPCELPLAYEPQGESVAFTTDGTGLVTVSERAEAAVNHTQFEKKDQP